MALNVFPVGFNVGDSQVHVLAEPLVELWFQQLGDLFGLGGCGLIL